MDYKEDYYLLQCIAQTYLDECRFEDDGKNNMRMYVDKRKWAMAERYIIKAFKIKPDNAEVLYTMGEVIKIYEEQKDIADYLIVLLIDTASMSMVMKEIMGAIPTITSLDNNKYIKMSLVILNGKESSKS